MQNIKEKAKNMLSAMEEINQIWRVKDEYDCYDQIIMNIHHKMDRYLPENSIYKVVVECLNAIVESENIEELCMPIEVCTSRILDWLEEDLNNIGYITDVLSEYDVYGMSGEELLMMAYQLFVDEIVRNLIEELEDATF